MENKKPAFVQRPVFLSRILRFQNLLILIILSFAVLTFLAKQYHYFRFDLYLTLLIQTINLPLFASLMGFITTLGGTKSVLAIVFLLAAYGYFIGKRHAPWVLILSTGGAFILSEVVKIIIARPRPDPLLIHQIGQFTK